MLRRGNYAWTAKDEAELKALAGRGVYLRNIALRLRRSESSIKKKANDLGLKVQRTPRFRLDGALRGSAH
jgi:hypothetical protein